MLAFDWGKIALGEGTLDFLWEVILRTTVMFIVLLITLKIAGKRGVRQLSIFETVIIIALGSAAGDPMFYEEVGILPALCVFAVVISLYRFVTYLTGRFEWFGHLIEGKTVCLIHEGEFSYIKFERESLAYDEFFSELRVKNIEHLGQVKSAYLEPSGEISIFYYADEEVKYGLPLRPELFQAKNTFIPAVGLFSCTKCGHTVNQKIGKAVCEVCNHDIWVAAVNMKRIS